MKLKNETMEVTFSENGAEITSVLYNGVERTNASKKYWGYTMPILFPIVGNLIEGKYFHNERAYEMKQHGFARLEKHKVVHQEDNYIEFELESNDSTWEIFPFDFKLITKYFLTDKNEVLIFQEVVNTGSESFNFAIGTHPSFKIDNVENYTLKLVGNFDNVATIPNIDGSGIQSESWKFDAVDGVIDLSFDLFRYDTLLLKDMEIETSILAKKDGSEEIIVNHGDYDRHLMVWMPDEDADFICIEPQFSLADLQGGPYELLEKPYTITLDPDESRDFSYSFQIVK